MITVADHWQGSDLGRQRQGNEDNYFVRSPLFVVADGMGGAQAGEVASEMAVESFDRGLPGDGTPAGRRSCASTRAPAWPPAPPMISPPGRCWAGATRRTSGWRTASRPRGTPVSSRRAM